MKLVCTEPNLSFSLQNGNITPHTEKGWARRNRIGETEPTDIRKKGKKLKNAKASSEAVLDALVLQRSSTPRLRKVLS